MKVSNILNCSFPVWYQRFSKVTAESVIIDLPVEFTEYLKADGVVLPDCLTPRPNARVVISNDSETSDSDVDWGSADEDVISAPSFPELDSKIKKAISDLGGKIYPKMNWSSPKDAIWIALNKSMCCYAVRDIYLLLKSSDFISHDLTQPFKDCSDAESESASVAVDYKLVLRKWIEIDPGCEFRCFVNSNDLIAISQRDHSSFYSYIEKTQRDIIRDILSFYKEHLKNKFSDDSYVFDVYRKCKDEVKLIDFNPYGQTTDSLLFEWTELDDIEYSSTVGPEIRFVNINRGVQPSPLRQYGLPRDMVDLHSGEDPYKLMDLLSLRRQQTGRNDFSSDDDADE